MKYYMLFIICIIFFGCNQPKHSTIESFWADFQKVVAANDRAGVTDLTVFPLKGTEFIGDNFNENGLTREQFLQQYETIFDEKTRQAIVNTPVNKLFKFVSKKEETLQQIGIPPGQEVYSFTVNYVFDEGQETQTESSVAFYFMKKEGIFKLTFLLIAG